MELLNATRMQAAYTMGTEPTAREHIVVAVKGTFAFPERAGEVCPLGGGAGAAGHGRRVLGRARLLRAALRGRLRAPQAEVRRAAERHGLRAGGQAGDQVRVGVKLGGWSKVFDVVGDRVWVQRGGTHRTLGARAVPRPCRSPTSAPSAAPTTPTRSEPHAYMPNPVGRGYGLVRSGERLIGRPAPQHRGAARPGRDALGRLPADGARRRRPATGGRGSKYRRHLRPELARQGVPVPARRLRRPLLPGRTGGPADRRAEGRRGGESWSISRREGRTRFRLPTERRAGRLLPQGRRAARSAGRCSTRS